MPVGGNWIFVNGISVLICGNLEIDSVNGNAVIAYGNHD